MQEKYFRQAVAEALWIITRINHTWPGRKMSDINSQEIGIKPKALDSARTSLSSWLITSWLDMGETDGTALRLQAAWAFAKQVFAVSVLEFYQKEKSKNVQKRGKTPWTLLKVRTWFYRCLQSERRSTKGLSPFNTSCLVQRSLLHWVLSAIIATLLPSSTEDSILCKRRAVPWKQISESQPWLRHWLYKFPSMS